MCVDGWWELGPPRRQALARRSHTEVFKLSVPVTGVGGSAVDDQAQAQLPGVSVFRVDGGYRQAEVTKMLVECATRRKRQREHTVGKGVSSCEAIFFFSFRVLSMSDSCDPMN